MKLSYVLIYLVIFSVIPKFLKYSNKTDEPGDQIGFIKMKTYENYFSPMHKMQFFQMFAPFDRIQNDLNLVHECNLAIGRSRHPRCPDVGQQVAAVHQLLDDVLWVIGQAHTHQ